MFEKALQKRNNRMVQFGALAAALVLGVCAPVVSHALPARADGDSTAKKEDPADNVPLECKASKKGTESQAELGRSYSIDESGSISTACGGKLALAVDDVFEPYSPSNATSAARLIGHTGTIGGGRLNSWGCWTGSCCIAGHLEAGPTGTQWVCDVWEDCTRCIIP